MIGNYKNSLLSNFLQKKEYVIFFVSMFIFGVASSSSVPLISLFLVGEIHVTASTAGLYFLTALVWPVVSIGIGHFSDHIRSRLPLIRFSSIWLGVGWGILAITAQFWQVLSVGVFFFCLTGTLSAQSFAAIRDVLIRDADKNENTITSVIRASYSLGWIVGPIIGSMVASLAGIRVTFLITSILYLTCLIILSPLKNITVQKRTSPQELTKAGKFSNEFLQLVCFAAVSTLVLSGDTIKSAYLPLYVTKTLHQSMLTFGSLLSVSAIVEIVVIPAAGVIADKVGIGIVMMVGMIIGIVDYTLLANSTYLWQFYLVQILHTSVIAALLGLGVMYAQQLYNRSPGFASSVFFGAQGLATPVGSVIGSLSISFLGIPKLFFLPALFCMIALATISVIQATRRKSPSRS